MLSAYFFPENMVPGTEFYMIDWCDAMIDFFVPWDKQFIFSLTNGR